VRNIPSFEETRRRTPARGKQQSHEGALDGENQNKNGLLIDFETAPGPPAPENGNDDTANPFDTFNATSAIREEMAATKERDEQERKDRERQNILEKRAARRKSMGPSSSYCIRVVEADTNVLQQIAGFPSRPRQLYIHGTWWKFPTTPQPRRPRTRQEGHLLRQTPRTNLPPLRLKKKIHHHQQSRNLDSLLFAHKI
jgi:hypothetical protein